MIFGEAAFTKVPLTLNYDILVDLLDKVQVGEAGDTTALGNGLARAVQRLKDSDAKSRIVILLTDGVSNAGNIPVDQAITAAKGFDVKVYTIGVGTGAETVINFVDSAGIARTVKQEVKLDEPTMKKIAEETGGEYFEAADTTTARRRSSRPSTPSRTQRAARGARSDPELALDALPVRAVPRRGAADRRGGARPNPLPQGAVTR